jgi:Cu(I)/Ag(I) efflux system membrane fusion protein
MKKNYFIIVIIAAVLVGIFLGHYFTSAKESGQHALKIAKKPLYWIDSMEPTIHYPGPGKSRMGMELTPVYPEKSQGDDASTIRISPTVMNNLGVRIAPVLKGALARGIETVGYVEPNENKISHIHPYAEGWVKNLLVKSAGEPVKKGQLLLQLYSPLLVNAQEEYLIALGTGNRDLIEASYKRLQAFHISEQQIRQLKSTRKSRQLIDIYSNQNGVVTMLNIREGMHVTPDTEIMSIVDLSSVWMMAQIYENQANWVKKGQMVEARLSAFPGTVYRGEVEYIYPQVDPMTRTLKVRFRFDNPKGILKPNMYARITLLTKPKQNVISIPLEALIRSSQGDHVIVAVGEGRFQARSVVVGLESGNRVEILSGLNPGENIVISGQFLIDSEANLKAGLQRIEVPTEGVKSQPPTAPQKSHPSIEGDGVIKALNISKRTLTIQHEAISELNWPAMTMDFSVASTVKLKDFNVKDHIQFTLKKVDDHFVVTSIKKLPD